MLTNESLFSRAKELFPGGVHSPVRSFKGLGIPPRFVTKAEGAYIHDVEGKNFIDFCMSFGPLILGHRHSQVESTLVNALQRGWSYGACEPYSLELAEFIVKKIPFIEQIRFMSSGTEAVMTAIRLARGFTKRDKIIKFNGCYHGHLDSMLIKAGSGLAGTAEASSQGVPLNVAKDTLIVELDDLAQVEQCFIQHEGEVAAIIIEPLPANNGLLIQDKDFLKGLRTLCDKYQALLIFDEVISGFRATFQGMSGVTGITPDLVTYGKVIGGGMPVGAVGGKKVIMEYLAPVGPVYQAGTLSANPLAMAAGLATLKELTPATYQKLENQTAKVVELFNTWFKKEKAFQNLKLVHEHSLFWVVPENKSIKAIPHIPGTLSEHFKPLFLTLLSKGIYLAPNAYEVGFVSLAHDDNVLKELEQRLWN